MTRPGHDPEQDAVRRLLAESRHDEPMPDDVRARLDDVLAGLTAERREVRETGPVVDLSARRRHRRRGALLAAAAVVVAGVGLGQVLERSGGSDAGDASIAQESAAQDGSGASEKRADAGSSEPEAASPATPDLSSLGAESDAALPVVRSTHLRDDLRLLRTGAVAARQSTPDLYAGYACAVSLTSPGRQVEVALDGDPAVAVFRPATGGHQEVEVYTCADGEQAYRVRLRVR